MRKVLYYIYPANRLAGSQWFHCHPLSSYYLLVRILGVVRFLVGCILLSSLGRAPIQITHGHA